MTRAHEAGNANQSTSGWAATFLHTHRLYILVIVIPLLVSLVFAAMYAPKHEADLTSQADHSAKTTPALPLKQPHQAEAAPLHATDSPATASTPALTQATPGPTTSTPSSLQGNFPSPPTTNPQTVAPPVPLNSLITTVIGPVCQTVPRAESQLDGSTSLFGQTLSGITGALNIPKCLD